MKDRSLLAKFAGAFLAVACLSAVAARYESFSVTDLLNIGRETLKPNVSFSGDNGTALTVKSAHYLITPSGQANGYTNTITLAAPKEAGDKVTLTVGTGATNKLGIADSGTASLSAAFAGDADDTITLIAPTTDEWVEVSRSAN